MSNAVQLAVAGFLSGKNRIINGFPFVQQRAALSLSNGISGHGTCDRWKGNNNAGSGVYQLAASSATDENGSVVVPFVQAAVTTAFPASLGSSALLRPIYQLVEGWNAVDLIGKQVTVSFVASATVVGRYAVVIRDGNTTPANVQACVKTFDITAANTRQAFDITFPAIPSNAVIPQSSATGFFLSFGAVAGSSLNVPTKDVWVQGNYESSSDVTNWATTVGNSLNITKVRLTDGIKPAPQEWRPYGLELALCQRYYIAGAHNFRGYELAGTNVIQTLSLPVSMRASPTLAWTTNPTVSSNVGIPTLGVLNVFQISFTGAVSTTGDCYWINGIWAANAEL